tara:strand:+ start:808 stop:1056 length:249 start_codon:yes stop_codon:yes gene_type:complete
MVKSVKTLNTMAAESVKNLTKTMQKMKVGFDRVAYRKAYDRFYFKRTAACPNCGETKTKHMLKRHMLTAKCRKNAFKAGADT